MEIQDKLQLSTRIQQQFQERFQELPLMFQSPGRINLIGEHTDYNNGYVLPAAIDKSTIVAISKRTDSEIHIYASDINAVYSTRLDQPLQQANSWSDYVVGIVHQFIRLNIPVTGFQLAFGGNVPIGSGMSSSAALECAVAYALNELFDAKLSKLELVKLAQKAENEFVGVNCGIMDQFASMFGKHNQVMRLDCNNLDFDYVPFEMTNFSIVLLDTQVKHSLGSSAYNIRRSQCEEGLALLQNAYPSLTNLRDASLQQLEEVLLEKHPILFNRCRYVMEENARLLTGCNELQKGNRKAFGKIMYASHEGLDKLYEVSCPELNFLIEQVKTQPAVYGGRMMGGGFGGCTINLVEADAVPALIEIVGNNYLEQTGISLLPYVVQIGNGTSQLNHLS